MKRLFDLVGAFFILVSLLPLLFIAVLVLAICIGRPIFFCQWRPGLDGKPFKMIKFRTMSDEISSDGRVLPDADRLTGMGRLFRSLSLDELPELWNVIKGDMSLVGPRPLLMDYLPLYSPEQARRHEVRPGITGWAQVNGRNALNWKDRFKFDVWYVDHHSIGLDIKILWLTIYKVFLREGITATGEATMSKFSGNSHD